MRRSGALEDEEVAALERCAAALREEGHIRALSLLTTASRERTSSSSLFEGIPVPGAVRQDRTARKETDRAPSEHSWSAKSPSIFARRPVVTRKQTAKEGFGNGRGVGDSADPSELLMTQA